MPEVPYIIVDNVLSDATTVATSLTAVAGFEISKVYDNLHHTSFKTTSATSPEAITVTPSAHAKVNCVIIDSMFSDTSGYYQVTINGSSVLNTQATQDIVEGVIILPFTEVVALGGTASVVINIYSTLTTKQLRHVHLGYYRAIKNPQLPHDPIQDKQEFRTQDNQDGHIINNVPVFTQRILEASWTMISPTDWTAFDYLRTNSFYTGTPFWYFLHPTSEPTVGHLYSWDSDSYAREFALAGYRNFALKAKANFSPDRTPDRYPFGFSKCLSFVSASSQYMSCTSFNIGTVHSIEFWIDKANPAANETILSENTTAESYVNLQTSGASISYLPTGDATGAAATYTSFSSGTKQHWVITRSAGTVKFYKNGTLLSNTVNLTNGSLDFKIANLGRRYNDTAFLNAKIGHFRIYNWQLNPSQVTKLYNSGNGYDYLPNGLYAIYECDDTGGTSTTEDNQEGTSARDMTFAVAAPTRTTW